VVEPMFHRVFDEPVVAGTIIELSGAEAKHAVSVKRMRVGEAIQLTDGAGLRVRGAIDSIAGNKLAIRVSEVLHEPAAQLQLTLVQALAKGDRDELAIQAATELGVFEVTPWQADRSISRWLGLKEDKGVERWQTIVSEAAKQSLRSWVPVVASAIESNGFETLFASFDLVLVLDPTAEQGIASIDLPSSGRVALVVGPEGGISDEELAQATALGGVRVHLGAPILRTSTAGVAAISAIFALSGQWS